MTVVSCKAVYVLLIVKINSESCTIVEDVIDEDQEVLEVWLIKLILLLGFPHLCNHSPYFISDNKVAFFVNMKDIGFGLYRCTTGGLKLTYLLLTYV